MTKPKSSGKRSLSQPIASQPITDTTKRLTQLLDGPKKRRRVTETGKKTITKNTTTASTSGISTNRRSNPANARSERTETAATANRWSHLSTIAPVSKGPIGEISGGLGRSGLALAPGFKKSAPTLKSTPAQVAPVASKSEHKRNPYEKKSKAGKKGARRVTIEPIAKATIPDKPTQNVASKENLGRNSRSKPNITDATVGGIESDDEELDFVPIPRSKATVAVATMGGIESDDDELDFTPIPRSKPIIAAAAAGGSESDDEEFDFTPMSRSKPTIAAAAAGGIESDDEVLDFTPMEQGLPSTKPSVSLFARKVPRGSARASSWTTRAPPTSLTSLEGTESMPHETDPMVTDDTAKAATGTVLISETRDLTESLAPLADTDAHSKANVPVLDAPAEPPKKEHKPLRALSVMGPIPKPAAPTETEETMGNNKAGGGQGPVLTKHKISGGNFVRLNMRNSAGACRGAKNKTKKSKWQLRKEERQQEWSKNRENKRPGIGRGNSGPPPSQTGVDPLDDFMDGAFHEPASKKAGTSTKKAAAAAAEKGGASRDAIPKCPGHQKPCKLLTVKKASTGNKGRQFYACSMPRGEQCNHFTWADDTAEAAKRALLKNSSHSGFIARQVASYMERLGRLTIPELRVVATKHNLNTAGKKQEILTRLTIWVRDEIADGSKELDLDDKTVEDNSAAASPEETENADPKPSLVDEKDGDASVVETEDPKPSRVDEKDGDASIDETDDPKPSPVDEKDDDASTDESSDDSDSDDEEEEDDDDSVSSEELEFFGVASEPCRKPPVSKEKDSLMESDEESDSCPTEDTDKKANTSCPLRSTLQTLFGHSEFRESQEWTIRRCLEKQRTLLVAPTGFGKSLCYSLPSTLMDGVCIVVSPLISLIEDQLRVLPPRLPAATLSGPLSTAKMAAIMDDVVRGRLKVLFVSPERLTSASFRRLFIPRWNPETRVKERHFPTVSLLCVDEAHCMSQWAHNFRPAYLRMRTMMELIQPESVLAITATAGPRVVEDICRTLNIRGGPTDSSVAGAPQSDDSGGVRVMKSDRDNIDVSSLILSNQEERLSKLIKLLTRTKGSAKGKVTTDNGIEEGCLAAGNVIVYVWRQRDAEAVAENLQASGVEGGIVVYHGGMDSGARSKSQSMFMRGKARICVATVAFGLGINKADVEGVIHMYLSASPEHYLQEIGRAGRDGRPAKAIALILSEEVLVRHSLAHSDLLSKSQIRNLLSLLVTNIKGSLASLPKERPDLGPINVALPLETSVLHCDCKAETIETLVSLLEQKDYQESLVRMEGTIYDSATVAPKRRTLAELATMEDIAKAILVSGKCVDAPAGEQLVTESTSAPPSSGGRKVIGFSYGTYTFSVAECANHLGPAAEPRHVFAALRRLQNNGEIELDLNTSPSGRGIHMKLTREGMNVLGEGNDSVLDQLATDIHDRFVSTVTFGTNKVLDLNNMLQQVSKVKDKENEESADDKSASLQLFQKLIHNYFETEGKGDIFTTNPDDLPDFSDVSSRELSMDASSVLSHLLEVQGSSEGPNPLQLDAPRHTDYAALAITKFLHGIAPVGTPLTVCRRHALFGRMQSVRFAVLQDAVARLLGGYKTR